MEPLATVRFIANGCDGCPKKYMFFRTSASCVHRPSLEHAHGWSLKTPGAVQVARPTASSGEPCCRIVETDDIRTACRPEGMSGWEPGPGGNIGGNAIQRVYITYL